MRNYWLRIIVGAAAIFAVGMVGVTLARQGMSRVRGVVEGSGPITLPVRFLPFKLDGERIGTIESIRIMRNAPKEVRSVNLRVRLADSVNPGRLDPCILVAEGFEDINDQTTVLCSNAKDTVGEDLVAVGTIKLRKSERSFQLFMPRDAIQEITDSDFVFVGEDSGEALARQGDSIAQVTQRMTDSILESQRPQLESLGVEVPRRPPGSHNPKPRVADSLRHR
jgi:hypothetical protein